MAKVSTISFRWTRGGSLYYSHTDGLGSVNELTDATGSVVRTYRYDSFGKIIAQTGSLDQPFTFTGRENDAETGLYYYRARYYDPKAGRFISKDPIGFEGEDVNLFQYVGNDPANFTDPSGLFAIPWPIIIPPIEKIVAPIIGGIIGGIIGNEILKECEKDKPCPPCNPPIGTSVIDTTQSLQVSRINHIQAIMSIYIG